ncbi:hypothetical protein CIB84_006727 [Bambusicola thoracicus]|uniref:Uncharacterized protein n=1 Tax=Bambusicola thoracicus TaxID=9083 RepID=A0A2P4SZJ5_BAMTH|nr:hypothetical protein CIB84_006727 [Bambusicola thoracicus]
MAPTSVCGAFPHRQRKTVGKDGRENNFSVSCERPGFSYAEAPHRPPFPPTANCVFVCVIRRFDHLVSLWVARSRV